MKEFNNVLKILKKTLKDDRQSLVFAKRRYQKALRHKESGPAELKWFKRDVDNLQGRVIEFARAVNLLERNDS